MSKILLVSVLFLPEIEAIAQFQNISNVVLL